MRLEKRKLIYLVVCIIVLPQITIAGSIHEVNQAWKERGYVAIARLESLAGKSDKMSQYKRLLEFAYATHVAPEKYDFVYKLENGTHFYKLILNKSKNPNTKTGVDEAGLFVINYLYDHQTGQFIGTKLELLPKGWFIHIHPTKPNILWLDVNDNGFAIIIDSSNPMNSSVESF